MSRGTQPTSDQLKDSRTILTGNKTYYVRTDGNDSNDGSANDASHAFLTIQKAIDVASTLDSGLYDITINVANGTYTQSTYINCKNILGSGSVSIVGNVATPASCIIDGGIRKQTPGTPYNIHGFKFIRTSSSPTYAVGVGAGGVIACGNLIITGSGWTYHFYSSSGGYLTIDADYTVSCNATNHCICMDGGTLRCVSITVTIGANITVSQFVYSTRLGNITNYSSTFSLGAYSVTGTKYYANMNSIIFVNGGGADYFPGGTAGSVAIGGQYA